MADKILIDGENFIHGVVGVLIRKNIISSREELKKLDLNPMLDDIKNYSKIRKVYYTTRIILPNKKSSLYSRFENMRLWNKRFIPYLMNQNVELIKAGVLKVVSSKKCSNCGKISEQPQEKGVDVKLGVDIVSLGGKDNTIYVFSSDSDLIPAILESKKRKSEIIYVALEGGVNKALTRVSNKTKIISKKQVIKSYIEANK